MSTTTFSTDPALYIFTSLTAGSSHIVTATSRLETILRANRVPFKAVDLAVDQKARMLWGRRAGKDESGRVRKLPALVQEGLVLGDIVEIEDWNEYGELKQHVKIYYDEFTIPNIHNKPKDPPKPVRRVKAGTAAAKAAAAAAASSSASASASSSTPAPASAIPAAPPLPKAEASTTAEKKDAPKKEPSVVEKATLPIRSIADEAAQKAKELRLQSLREKVHGKGGKPADTKEASAKESETPAPKESEAPTTKDSETPAVEKPEATATKEPETPAAKPPATPTKTESTSKAEATTPAKADKGKAAVSPLPASTTRTIAGTTVQSPTSGTWPTAASSSDALPSLETVQSPTTARWKSTESIEPPVTVHRGSIVAAASEAEIKAVEKATAIQEEEEEDSSEEESSEEESSEEDDEEEDDDDDDDEEEDDDDEDEDDDDDDDDSDDSDEEEETKPAPKAAPAPAEASTPAPAPAPAPVPAATEAPAAQK